MIKELLILPNYFLQTVTDTSGILSTKEVTIIGILLFIILTLISAVGYLYKRNEKLTEKRLEEQKEFTKELLQVTKATSETVRQVNEMLKITKNV